MTHTGTVHDALADRAFLHDDPVAYLAGVDDAVAEALDRQHAAQGAVVEDPPAEAAEV